MSLSWRISLTRRCPPRAGRAPALRLRGARSQPEDTVKTPLRRSLRWTQPPARHVCGGPFDEAVKLWRNRRIGRNLRRHWSVGGSQWILADPAGRRVLAAAASRSRPSTSRGRGDSASRAIRRAPRLRWASSSCRSRRADQATHVMLRRGLTGGGKLAVSQRVPDRGRTRGRAHEPRVVRFPVTRAALERSPRQALQHHHGWQAAPVIGPLAVLHARGCLCRSPRQTRGRHAVVAHRIRRRRKPAEARVSALDPRA